MATWPCWGDGALCWTPTSQRPCAAWDEGPVSRVVWVVSGTHAAVFWGSVVCWPRVFESGWGGILFGEPKRIKHEEVEWVCQGKVFGIYLRFDLEPWAVKRSGNTIIPSKNGREVISAMAGYGWHISRISGTRPSSITFIFPLWCFGIAMIHCGSFYIYSIW